MIPTSDFLDWSLTHEKLLLSCLTRVSDGILRESLYPLEAVKWLHIIRSQFVHAELCTSQSASRLESILKGETLESNVTPQGGSIMIVSLNASDSQPIDPVARQDTPSPAQEPDCAFNEITMPSSWNDQSLKMRGKTLGSNVIPQGGSLMTVSWNASN